MRKRLFDGLDQGLGEEIVLLEGLPPVAPPEATCDFCQALHEALGLLGREVSLARVMGLTGAAFMTPWGEGMVASWSAARVDRYLSEALAALGLRARREQSPVEEALALCREPLRAGQPVLARGPDDGWATVVGLKGEELLGRVPGSGRPYERLTPPVQELILCDEAEAPPPLLAANLQALARADVLLGEAEEAWLQWREALAEPAPYGAGAGRLERFLAEQHLTACVVEARDAAHVFLAETAAATDYDLAEALDTAAEAADIAVSLAETLLAAPDAIALAHLPEDESWLDRRREQLGALSRCDERLRSAILEALDLAGEEHQMSNLPV
ncbi:hypothetical protein LLH23_22365 [bacterium]|nr:hypothetical protein [bacterium]